MKPHAAALTANQIAAEIGRAAPSVYEAITRLGIRPVFVAANGQRYYLREAIEVIRHSMRAPNKKP